MLMQALRSQHPPYPLHKGDSLLFVIQNGACVVKNLECIAQLLHVDVLEILRFTPFRSG